MGGYAPLVVGVALAAAVVVVAPSTGEEKVEAEEREVGIEGEPATGWKGAGATVTACEGGGLQVPDDPYSPPCFAFAGDNGGETSKGVTGDTITVTYRQTPEPNVLALLAQLMGIEFDETAEDFQRTVSGLIDYFNATFQLYGRQMELEIYDGQGAITTELVGGGREAASIDGLKAATEIGAFADVTATTQPYAEALATNETIGFGAPYLSREWFGEHRPYAWSLASDCSVVGEAASAYGLARLIGQPADRAEGDLRDQTRKMAVISPNNAEYQRCADAGLKVVEDAGEEIDFVTDYALDLGRIPNQATSIATELVRQGITTISCFCDPFMLLNLIQQVDAAGIDPEWIVTGVGFIDLDLIGQGLSKQNDQWDGAFGASPLGVQPELKDSPGYKAFKSVRPDEEPSVAVDVFYYQLYQLALGIQMAGPELTPLTLETGLLSYPEHTGPAGTWDYFEDSYTPIIDLREVVWDPDVRSPFNGQMGSYVGDGPRFRREDVAEILGEDSPFPEDDSEDDEGE
ncbi:MAG TPA: ABC transporter substrate-binding protein [Iamia sp.]|nr:ABC transporter substrate-binding protein [Iamia sp.]